MMTNPSLAATFANHAQAHPDKVFFRFLDRGETEVATLCYGALDARARQIAAQLLDRGLAGQVLPLVFEPGPDFVEALFGCFYAGIAAAPAPAPRAGASLDRLEGIVASLGARHILTSAALRDGLGGGGGLNRAALFALGENAGAASCPGLDLSHEAPVVIQFTSGSTLDPRGVILNSACLQENCRWIARGLRLGEEEVMVSWIPHFHDMGLVGMILLPAVLGHEAVHMPTLSFVQQPSRWLQAISTYGGTMCGGPPVGFDLCTARVNEETIDTLDLSRWHAAFCGAEPVFEASLAAFRRRFSRAGLMRRSVYSVYGLAETTVYAGGSPLSPPWEKDAPGEEPSAQSGPVRRAPCHLDAEARSLLRIVSSDGVVLPEGQEGEIWITGPSVAAGYWRDAAATARVFRNRLAADDGRDYLRTGDLGILEGEILTITGRIKDVLIRGGANFSASDVEHLGAAGRQGLNPHGAAAFQCDGPATPIVLLIERQRGASLDGMEDALVRAIRRTVSDRLGISLDEIHLLDPGTLPRTTSGKIQRARARDLFLAGEWTGKGCVPRSEATSERAQ